MFHLLSKRNFWLSIRLFHSAKMQNITITIAVYTEYFTDFIIFPQRASFKFFPACFFSYFSQHASFKSLIFSQHASHIMPVPVGLFLCGVSHKSQCCCLCIRDIVYFLYRSNFTNLIVAANMGFHQLLCIYMCISKN